jgi:hypothetical protein
VGDEDTPLGQDQLYITQAQAEHMVVQPNSMAHDLNRKPVPVVIAGGLWRHPASLARFADQRQPELP